MLRIVGDFGQQFFSYTSKSVNNLVLADNDKMLKD